MTSTFPDRNFNIYFFNHVIYFLPNTNHFFSYYFFVLILKTFNLIYPSVWEESIKKNIYFLNIPLSLTLPFGVSTKRTDFLPLFFFLPYFLMIFIFILCSLFIIFIYQDLVHHHYHRHRIETQIPIRTHHSAVQITMVVACIHAFQLQHHQPNHLQEVSVVM